MIKKNIKVISMFILGVVCALGITISAYSMNGKKVLVKVNGWNVKNLEEAVSYLKDGNQCAGLSPVAKVISGNKNTVGSVVRIGEEEFYVIGQGTGDEAGKTKLLAKYALKDNNQVESGATVMYFAYNNSGWCKDGVSNGDYVYGNYSYTFSIVNNYVTKLTNLGVTNVTGRLMSYEEATELPSDILNIADRYWLGTRASCGSIYAVSGGSISPATASQADDFSWLKSAVRPVILVPTNKIG